MINMNEIKIALRQSSLTKELYKKMRAYRDNRVYKKRLSGKFSFDNRSKNQEKLCIILAGYKEAVWDDVFGRLEKFLPDDIDFCVITSGKVNDRLRELCRKNNWSYISTKRNCVTLAQNIAIEQFKSAKYIYKLDEDIFVTKKFFETLYETYERVEKDTYFKIGFVAPLIPINGYAHVRVLEKFGVKDDYIRRFGPPACSGDLGQKITLDPEIAKFFWGAGGVFPKIDEANDFCLNSEFDYTICPVRFSIGAIMFPRSTWEDMKGFEVESGNCLGLDETQLCSFCMLNSRVIIVSENSLVGHLGYGPQNKEMITYYSENRNMFELRNN